MDWRVVEDFVVTPQFYHAASGHLEAPAGEHRGDEPPDDEAEDVAADGREALDYHQPSL